MATSTIPLRVEALEKARECDAEKLETLEAWMNGNGTPGVKTRLALLEDSVKRIEAKLDGLTKAAVGVGISVLLAVIAYLLTNLLPQIVAHLGA